MLYIVCNTYFPFYKLQVFYLALCLVLLGLFVEYRQILLVFSPMSFDIKSTTYVDTLIISRSLSTPQRSLPTSQGPCHPRC